jgi:iron complex transport system substrate-binding protein
MGRDFGRDSRGEGDGRNERNGWGERPTRRECLTYGGSLIAGGVLAGCTGRSGAGDGDGNASNGSDGSGGDGADGSTDGSDTDSTPDTDSAGGSYSASMEPVGSLEFESVPERFVVYHQGWVDIALSLGQGGGIVGAGFPSTFPVEYLDRLQGISFDPSGIRTLGEGDSVDKEVFYEMSPDLHLVDPNTAMQYFGLEEADIEELTERVAPFFGSWMRRPQFNENYPYYELYEGFDRVARVFRVEPRGEAFKQLHQRLIEEVRSRLPPVGERPSIGYLNVFEGSVYMRDPSVPGYQTKPLRALEVPKNDAFAGMYSEGENYVEGDFETLLEVDPEVIILHAGLNSVRDGEEVLKPFRESPVASEVTAVKDDRVYPWHEFEQGPIVNQFQTEVVAKSLYPEEFGPPAGMELYAEGFGAPAGRRTNARSEQLFDRKRVADIVNGKVR